MPFAAGVPARSSKNRLDKYSEVEAVLPERAITLDPLRDTPKRSCLKPARPPLCLAAAADQAGPFENLEMLRDRGWADRERVGQLFHRGLAQCETRQNRAARWVRESCKGGAERIGD